MEPSDKRADAARRRDQPTGGRVARFIAILAVVGTGAMIVYVVMSVRGGGTGAPQRVFDPATTNAEELRRVTEAVSRIIAGSAEQHEIAVQTLEAVRADSAGARDLKDACVNTYRGQIRAETMLHELQRILIAPDGGEVPAAAVSASDRTRALELQRQMEEQIDLVNDSKDRCLDLYTEATRTMGLSPATHR